MSAILRAAREAPGPEIRIVCDNIEHPHHKGRIAHITAFEYRGTAFEPKPHWTRSLREYDAGERRGIARRGDASIQFVSEPAADIIKKHTGWETTDRTRFELGCPRCGYRVVAREIDYVLDGLRDHGITQISLKGLTAAIHTEARETARTDRWKAIATRGDINARDSAE